MAGSPAIVRHSARPEKPQSADWFRPGSIERDIHARPSQHPSSERPDLRIHSYVARPGFGRDPEPADTPCRPMGNSP